MRRRVLAPFLVLASCATVAAGVLLGPDSAVDSTAGDEGPGRPATLTVRVFDAEDDAVTGATVVVGPYYITGFDDPPMTAAPREPGTYVVTTRAGDYLVRATTASGESTAKVYLGPGKRKTVDVRVP